MRMMKQQEQGKQEQLKKWKFSKGALQPNHV